MRLVCENAKEQARLGRSKPWYVQEEDMLGLVRRVGESAERVGKEV